MAVDPPVLGDVGEGVPEAAETSPVDAAESVADFEIKRLGMDPMRRIQHEPDKRDEILDAMRTFDQGGAELELDSNNITPEEVALLLEHFLGAELCAELSKVYHGRGGPLRPSLEHTVYYGFMNNACDLLGIQGLPEHKRTGNDEVFNHPVNKRIRALIGFDCYYKLQDHAREVKVCNASAFKAMIHGLVVRNMV